MFFYFQLRENSTVDASIIQTNKTVIKNPSAAPLASRCYSHGRQETEEEFDARWVTYFNKPDIDHWELRKGEEGAHVCFMARVTM